MLLRRGRVPEGVTLGWNVAGIVVLAVAVLAARSVALAGFGLDQPGAARLVQAKLTAPGSPLWVSSLGGC